VSRTAAVQRNKSGVSNETHSGTLKSSITTVEDVLKNCCLQRVFPYLFSFALIMLSVRT
jgi:hypothetical protein